MISIIVPCYNAEKSIDRTVKSLRQQTVHDYQIVLVDDGSNDRTPRLCDEYAKSDSRIKVIHQKNHGLMGAWKQGVMSSDGDHILFCDADDYVDTDLVEKVYVAIGQFAPDIVIYGMVFEYPNGERTRVENMLDKGYYDSYSLKQDVLPHLFSDGRMQSELITKSRCSKCFKKEILLSVIPCLNESVSLGEDQLTMFATVQVAQSIYCMGDYCPYHYVRTSESMIGGFDKRVFLKLRDFYIEMERIAKVYDYRYPDQILCDKMSVLLLYVKKYICRSDEGYRSTRSMISKVRNSRDFEICITRCTLDKYNMSARLFAILFIKRMYLALYILSRTYERIKRGNTGI